MHLSFVKIAIFPSLQNFPIDKSVFLICGKMYDLRDSDEKSAFDIGSIASWVGDM